MNLTSKGRYAIMAMADISHTSQKSDKQPISTSTIAERQNISPQYLEQILNILKRNNLLNSVKGPGGGYVIARNATDIKLIEIIDAVDEKTKMTKCSPSSSCTIEGKCITHNLWMGLSYQINKYFESISLNDLCDNVRNKEFYEKILGE